jgi:putative ABC transport system permease protein
VAGVLVALEIAFCLVALGGGSVLVQTFRSVRAPDPGFEPRGLLVVEFGLPHWKYEGSEEWVRVLERLEERAGEVPGVLRTGLVSQPPQALMIASDTFRVEGREEAAGAPARSQAQVLWASPGHRPTLGMPLLMGRFFDDRDRRGAPPAVVVSESLARRYFEDGTAVGRRLWVRGRSREIVGVVGDVQQSLVPQAEGAVEGTIYIPRLQEPSTFSFLLARVEGDARGLADPVRRAFWDVDPDVTVHAAEPHSAYARRFTAPLDVITPMVSLFGVFALLLAALGTYGVVSRVVARRRHELGVRLALGARPAAVVGLVARQGLVMAAAGLALGTVLLVPLVRVAGATLQGFALASVDTAAVVGAGVVLLGVTLVACVLPALRAGRVDPAKVLRVE